MGRKIPGRKHRGVRDPEKQAAVRFEKIKDKVNTPPTNPDNQEISKSLQKIIDLKNKTKSGEFKRPTKKKTKHDNNSKSGNLQFERLPGEKDRQFLNRVNKMCTDVIRETHFEQKFGVEIKRDENGEIEAVVKREKDELELLIKKAKKEKKMKQQKGNKKIKKESVKEKPVHLSKWQKRKRKLIEKENRKRMSNEDEFKEMKDVVKFGEVAHAPPTLTVIPRKAAKWNDSSKPEKKLLLHSLFAPKNTVSQNSKSGSDLKGTINKVIDKKGKRKELPNAMRRQLDQQQKEIIDAYKKLKSKKYK